MCFIIVLICFLCRGRYQLRYTSVSLPLFPWLLTYLATYIAPIRPAEGELHPSSDVQALAEESAKTVVKPRLDFLHAIPRAPLMESLVIPTDIRFIKKLRELLGRADVAIPTPGQPVEVEESKARVAECI